MTSANGIVYLLHFDAVYVPYPGAPLRDCAKHYTGRVRRGPRALAKRLGSARHRERRAADAGGPRGGHHLAARAHVARWQRPGEAAQTAGRRLAPLPAVRREAAAR